VAEPPPCGEFCISHQDLSFYHHFSMKQTDRIKEGKLETRGDVGYAGGSIFVIGLSCSGCLFITVVGIPLLIVTLPIALSGLVMLAALPFIKTKDVKCPSCGEVNRILEKKLGSKKELKVFTCRECEKIVTFAEDGTPKI